MADPRSDARVATALARLCEHAEREIHLLDRAEQADDPDTARRLNHYARDAYRDAMAIAREHDIEF
jgi:hypothetical protein